MPLKYQDAVHQTKKVTDSLHLDLRTDQQLLPVTAVG
jgi:hypothetical protein